MPEQIVQSTGERLFQYGVLGIVAFLFGWVIWYLFKTFTEERKALVADYLKYRTDTETKFIELQREHATTVERLQQLRNDDAKAYQALLVEQTKNGTAAMANVSSLLEGTKNAMFEVRDTMRDLGDDLRRRS